MIRAAGVTGSASLLLFALLFGAVRGAASADADFDVSPTTVRLSNAAPSSPITITNTGTVPLRIQANGFTWQQALDGSIVLTPVDSLLVYPVVLSLQPGEFRLVRIGTTAKSEENERSFRVVIAAFPLDPAQETTGAKSLSLRARVSVPIFLAPLTVKTGGDVADAVVHKNKLTFTVRNDGTTHFFARKAHVTVMGAGGETIASGDVDGWYVLAGDRRPFIFPLPAGACAKAASVSVDVTGPPFPAKKLFEHVQKQCGET